MICCFCAAHVDTVDDAIDAGWVPSFWVGQEREYEGPVCPGCVATKVRYSEADGEYELRDGVSLPPLAIPLAAHPNLAR